MDGSGDPLLPCACFAKQEQTLNIAIERLAKL